MNIKYLTGTIAVQSKNVPGRIFNHEFGRISGSDTSLYLRVEISVCCPAVGTMVVVYVSIEKHNKYENYLSNLPFLAPEVYRIPFLAKANDKAVTVFCVLKNSMFTFNLHCYRTKKNEQLLLVSLFFIL